MADRIIPQREPLTFTATRGVYQFCPEASTLDLEDQLSAKQTQLDAMLGVGVASDMPLVGKNDASSFFWACRQTAEEIICAWPPASNLFNGFREADFTVGYFLCKLRISFGNFVGSELGVSTCPGYRRALFHSGKSRFCHFCFVLV